MIAWCKVNGSIQLALRSKIIILILLKILLVLESYMFLVIMRITTPGIRIPYFPKLQSVKDRHYIIALHMYNMRKLLT